MRNLLTSQNKQPFARRDSSSSDTSSRYAAWAETEPEGNKIDPRAEARTRGRENCPHVAICV